MKRILLFLGILSCWISNAQVVAPVTESFDNSALPSGWSTSSATGGPWLFSFTTNSVFCSAAADHTGNSGGYAAMDQSGGDAGVIMEMDTVDVTALTVPYLEFYYWMCGAGYSPPNITVIEAYDGTSSWNYVASLEFATNGWQKVGLELTNYVYGNNRVKLRFRAESGGSGSDFYGDNAIDDITIDEAPSCSSPLAGLIATNITGTSFDVNWNTTSNASSWNVIYGLSGFNPASGGTTTNVTSSNLSITNLTSNTAYDFYVVSDCGTGGTSDTAWYYARTSCASEAVGYFNGFEADAANAAPLCWSGYVTNPNSTATVINFSGPNTGVNHLRLTSSTATAANGDTLGIVTPELVNLSSGLNQVRFFAQTDDVAEQLIVGTVPHPDSLGSFTPLDTISFSGTFSYQEVIVPVSTANGYNGTDSYVAFVHSLNATFNGLYIDDFNYEVIPPCPKVTAVNVISVSDTSVTLDFASSGNAVGYEWGPTGFQQGTGTNDTIKSGSPITITGLGANTTYDVYLRNDCRDSSNGQSIWTGPITFLTNCGPIPAPYNESFDNTSLPSCWSQSATAGGPWLFQNSNNSVFCPPATDNTGNGGNYTWMDQSGTDGLVSLTMPVVDVSSLTVPYLEFYYWMCGLGYTPPNLTYIEAWDGNAWVNVDTLDYGTNGWEKTGYDLTSYVYNSSFVQIRFTAESGGSGSDFYGDNALDDVFIFEKPSCNAPVNLSFLSRTTNSISFGWDSDSLAVGTNIQYGASGFTLGSGFTQSTTDSLDTIMNLNSNTSYDIYIQDSCGASNGNSIWIGPLTVTTKCVISATSLPFFEGFENFAAGPYTADNDFCEPTYIWEFLSGGANGRLRVTAGPTFVKTGLQAATLDQTTFGGRASNFLTLNVDLSNYTTANGIELGFSVLAIAQEADDDNRVWVRGSQSDPWVEIVNLDNVASNGVMVDVANVDIVGPLAAASQAVSSTTQIRFGQSGTANAFSIFFSDGYSFDDVSLTQVSCPTPTGLTVNSIVDTSATISWNAGTGANAYEVWFGPLGFFQGTQTNGGGFKDTITTTSLVIDTLSENSCYEYLMRIACGPGDSSMWVGPIQFCTPCSTVNSPYYQDYDTWPVNCWDVTLGDQDWTIYNGVGGDNYAEARFWSFNAQDMVMRSLPINVTADSWMRFDWSHLYSTVYPDDQLIVRAQIIGNSTWDTLVDLIGPNDFNDATAGNTIPGSFITSTTVLDPATYTNQTVVFEFIANSDFGPDLFVNDFAVEVIPSCYEPANLSSGGITATDANLYWDQGDTTQSGNFMVSYGINLTDPNAGTQMMVSVDSLALSSLMPSTTYCWFVREICGPGDSSTWAAGSCFQTQCSSFLAPYSESFDNTTLPLCWTQSATAGGPWLFQFTNNSVNCPAATDNTGNGGNYAWMDQSGTDGLVSMTTPIVDVSALTTPYLEFYYWMCGVGYTPINITYVDAWDGTSWTPIDTLDQATSGWEKQGYDLTSYTYGGGSFVQIRFTAESGGSTVDFYGDNAIDDVLISEPITCAKPINLSANNISATGATLHWDSDSGTVNGNYVVSYGLGITHPDSGTVVSVNGTDSLVLASGLTASSSNCFFVAEVCTPGDTSLFTGPFCFNTLCLPFTAPFVENFDNTTMPNCWSQTATAGGPWLFQNSNNSVNCPAATDNTGNGGNYTWMDQSGTDGLVSLITPEVDISALTNPSLEFYYWMCGVGYTPINRTYIDAWDGAAWVNVDTLDSATTGWELQVYDLSTYTYNTSFVQIRFTAESGGSTLDFYGDNAIDDVSIINGNPCASPTGLDTANVVCNNADLIWTSGSNTLFSSVEYGVAGFTPGTGTVIGNAVSPQNVVLTGGTTYEFYVTDSCASGTSNPAGPFTFTTPVCPSCVDPILDTANVGCSSADLVWISGATTIASALEWGPSGFAPGTGAGTIIAPATSPVSLTGLTPGASYDYYVIDYCANDTSNIVSFSFTTASGPISASFTQAVDTTTTTYQTISFDASGSSGATSYSWNFGDGTTGSGMTTSNQYTIDSTWTVTLIVTGDCGSDTITQTVTTSGISIEETPLARTLQLYPNPTRTMLNISFDAQSAGQATFSILDLSGRVVMEVVESNVYDKYQGTLDISHLANGTYMLEIESAGVTVKRRVIKQ